MNYILLPAFNEKKNLVKIFQKINKICKKIKNITVILVDDCSTDSTILLKNKKYKFKLIYSKHKKNILYTIIAKLIIYIKNNVTKFNILRL